MKDNEVEGEGDVYDFGARMYDARLGRFMSVDPLSAKFPSWSTYVFAYDNPISLIDFDGMSGENPRDKFYKEFGTPIIKKMDDLGLANKYKALYIIAQKRAESNFDLKPKNGGNIFNITGTGDKGSVPINAKENDKNGKPYMLTQNYAVYSSMEKAVEGYYTLIKEDSRYADANKALFNDNLTISDFTKGLKNYATNPVYGQFVKKYF